MIVHDNRGRAAGVLAAAMALAVTELATAGGGPSLIESIGSQFIVRFAEPFEALAIELFGTNDKVALKIGIVVVALLIGAALGRASLRRATVGVGGFVAFGALGIAAGLADPLASAPRTVLACVLGVAVGVGTLKALLRAADNEAVAATRAVDEPTTPHASRRSFLMLAGTTGAVAVAGAGVARVIRAGADGASRLASVVLPQAKKVVAVPASQPFTTAGLSSYITPSDEFYRIDTALFIPRVDASKWRLHVKGLVDRPFELSYEDLLAMDMVEEPITMSCVSNEIGGDLVGTATWLGVPLVDLLERAGVRRGADQIMGRSVDGFTAGFPTEAAMDGRSALVVVGMNGEVLPERHGFPARLVVAGLYGYVSATKWLRDIELTRLDDADGYWIPRGWSKEAPIKITSRIDVPRHGDRVMAGPVAIAGVAWAPPVGIGKVEISVDEGPWTEAKLGAVASSNTWVQWMARWEASEGLHSVRVRATDRDGKLQTAERASPRPDGATGYHSASFVAQ